MLAQALQIFLGKEQLVKNWLISTLGTQGNLLQRNNFSAVYKTSLPFTKSGGYQLKNYPFFKHASSSIAPKLSMLGTSKIKCR
jgi:hypothetical protein